LEVQAQVPASDNTDSGLRLDRWLWAARFYKTRSIATEAISGGKVQLNGHRAKRSKLVHVGDEIRIRKGPYEQLVVVKGLSERRGSATEAQTLYVESTDSRERRERLAAQLKAIPETRFRGKGRPTKKERRDINRFRGGE
jgi:ribosome-associated heat shock protein Hsp15